MVSKDKLSILFFHLYFFGRIVIGKGSCYIKTILTCKLLIVVNTFLIGKAKYVDLMLIDEGQELRKGKGK